MDFQKKRKILKCTLVFQGLYYFSTGLWAIISLDSFMRFTEHHGEPFEMYSIGAMAFVIGLFLLWSAFKEELRRPAGFLVLGLVFDINSETILAMKAEREKLVEEERSKTLEKLIDEVAHEIRNPLTSIGGFT